MIDLKQRTALQRAINRHTRAEVAECDRGLRGLYAGETWVGIAKERKAARNGLVKALDKLTLWGKP